MKVRLKEGKQKELILLAKEDLSWKKLSQKLKVNEGYLFRDLKYEKRLLSDELYENLCKLAKVNFDDYILEKLGDNWGKIKGGLKSTSNAKKFLQPEISKDLSEIFGIILGDGHLSEIKNGSKIRVYCIRISGNYKTDKEYMFNYVPNLFKKVFNKTGSILKTKDNNGCYFTIYGKKIVEFMKINGFKPGNKIKNKQRMPNWIKEDRSFLKYCIRGLIDTDGSIHLISKNNKNLRIDFTSYIPELLEDVRSGLIKLGFNPSKIISNKHIFLSRKEEIEKYVKEVGFGNSKNLNRYYCFKTSAPVV